MIWNNIQDCKASIDVNVRCLLADLHILQNELYADVLEDSKDIVLRHIDSIKELLSYIAEYSNVYKPIIDMTNFYNFVMEYKGKIYDELDILKRLFGKMKDKKGIYHNFIEKCTREIFFLSEKVKAVYSNTYFNVDSSHVITTTCGYEQNIKDFIYIASCQYCEVNFATIEAKIWLKTELEKAGITIKSLDDEDNIKICVTPFNL